MKFGILKCIMLFSVVGLLSSCEQALELKNDKVKKESFNIQGSVSMILSNIFISSAHAQLKEAAAEEAALSDRKRESLASKFLSQNVFEAVVASDLSDIYDSLEGLLSSYQEVFKELSISHNTDKLAKYKDQIKSHGVVLLVGFDQDKFPVSVTIAPLDANKNYSAHDPLQSRVDYYVVSSAHKDSLDQLAIRSAGAEVGSKIKVDPVSTSIFYSNLNSIANSKVSLNDTIDKVQFYKSNASFDSQKFKSDQYDYYAQEIIDFFIAGKDQKATLLNPVQKSIVISLLAEELGENKDFYTLAVAGNFDANSAKFFNTYVERAYQKISSLSGAKQAAQGKLGQAGGKLAK